MQQPANDQPSAPEPLLRLLFEQAPGFVAVLEGPEHVFKLANPSYHRLVGAARELVGKSVARALPEVVAQGFVALLDKVFATGQPFLGRRLPYTPEGIAGEAAALRHLDFVYQPIFDSAGRTTGIFVEGHDVTEQVEAESRLQLEAEIRAAQARTFDMALSSIQDFAYTFDRQLRFTYSNKPLLDLLGITLEEIVGKTFWDLPYPQDLADRLSAQIEQVFVTKAQVVGETFYASPTGVQGWFEYIFNPVIGPDGSVTTVAGSTRDITKRLQQEKDLAALNESERTARAEAERASRMKDEFLATLSHELRTPLNAILAWSELLRSGRLGPEKAQEAVERISRNARAQAQLIADLLDVNGIMSGKVSLGIERLPIGTPLMAAIDAVRLDAAKKAVELVEPPRSALTTLLDCDPGRLQQVFWNLLTNAVKFTPAGGSVTVSVDVGSDQLVVRVSDSGDGIDAQFLPYLFERFSQADSSSTRKYGGLGLGLSICKSLVQLHDGEIAAQSSGLGQGACFTVTLPLRQTHVLPHKASRLGSLGDAPLPPADKVLALQGARILVVDDDAEGREVVTAVLNQYGANAVAVGSAQAALEELTRGEPALLLCDIGMPQVDGYELLRRVRLASQVPAIAFTAFARDEDKQRALDSGFAAHITKPAEPATTISVCADVLGRVRGVV